MAKFWNFNKVKNEEDNTDHVELRIDGPIMDDDESWIYEWFGIPCASPNVFRSELSQYKGQDITVWIDSCGGDVFAASGIYNALKEHNGKVTTKIDGKAMSAASVIAMAGDEVLMSPVGVMMIHNPLSAVQGYASDMRKQADVLDTIKESIVNAYALKTGKSRNKISDLMDAETYMNAQDAVKNGFADGTLYDDKETNSKVMNFIFDRKAILNCSKDTIKHLLNINAQQKVKENKAKKENEEETIVDLNELKNKYPDIYKDAYNEGKESGINEERDRLKAIDEIGNSIDNKLLNSAKYENPITAEKLALESIKNDAKKGGEYLNNINNAAETSKVKEVEALGDAPLNELEQSKKNVKDASSKIASFFKNKRK